jgi:hypothetical protein
MDNLLVHPVEQQTEGRMKRRYGTISLALIAAVLIATMAARGAPDASAAFAYQGRLTDGGFPANGAYDLRLRLVDEGGTQVGPTVLMDNVPVTGGLFTVYPDFGAVFDGTRLFMETGVRPGSSIGAYTVLSPNTWLSPVPYAYAARTVTLPLILQHSGQYVIHATLDSGSGIGWETLPNAAVRGDADDWAGLEGTARSGWGVFGISTSGTGVQAVGRTALAAAGHGAADTALEITRGAIKVRDAGIGTDTPVFVHVATAGNITGSRTAIDHPHTNNTPGAILLVTHNMTPGGTAGTTNTHALAVRYNSTAQRWEIANADGAGMPSGAAFNVLVVKP